MKLHITTAVLLLSTICSAQFLDSRNRAMGGTGVASSHYTSAGFINPALLTRFGDTDDFGLIIPSIGTSAADNDGLVEGIDDFQDSLSDLRANFAPSKLEGVAQKLEALSGDRANLGLGFGLSAAMPSDSFAWALIAHSYVDAQVGLSGNLAADANTIRTAGSGGFPTLTTKGEIRGAMVTEVGFAMATELSLGGIDLSIGATPKAQRIDAYNYSVGIADFEDGFDDFRDSKYRSNSTGFNVDVGTAASFFDDTLTIGLAGRNLVEHELKTVASGSTPAFTHHIGPTFKAGAALNFGGATLAADVDVTEIDRFKNNDESRFANVGAEFNLVGWMQFRAGYQTDLEDTVDDMITAGVGLSPFDLFHVDLAAVYGEGDTYGAMLQFWITF